MTLCHGLALCLAVAFFSRAEDLPPKPASHTTKEIEGWTVQVDDRLLTGSETNLGRRAMRLLEDRLYEIKLVSPADKLARLQKVPIWLDRSHGKLVIMQYHVSPIWLANHGYATNLAKCVHIPDAAEFLNLRRLRDQPWAVLHELAHAYHDQVLGYDDSEIKTAWKKFKDSGKYESVLHVEGHTQKHYALTNPMEFFAEMTEAYFGQNDFFPFNRGELKKEEPELFELMRKIWEGEK